MTVTLERLANGCEVRLHPADVALDAGSQPIGPPGAERWRNGALLGHDDDAQLRPIVGRGWRCGSRRRRRGGRHLAITSSRLDTTRSCWSAVMPGNMGSERIESAAASDTGNAPFVRPRCANAGVRCTGNG